MKKAIKTMLWILGLFMFAWAALSAYFIVAGRDSQDDCFCEYSPDIDYFNRIRALPPEENALTHLKWLEENMPTNTTPLYRDYRLMQAYIDGTTNRMEFADEVKEFIAAESNTFACAKRLLDCQVLDISPREIIPVSGLVRIANMSRVKAVYEASQGDIAKGRQTLMDAAKICMLAMDNESYSVGLSHTVGFMMARSAFDAASQPLFVNGEEEWRANLRREYSRLLANDAESMRTDAKRFLYEYWRHLAESCSTNRTMTLGYLFCVNGNPFENAILSKFGTGVGNAFPGQKWKGVERHFIAALLTAFPGYAGYAFQPNRSLGPHRNECARFCQKVGEPYDIEYAKEFDFGFRGDNERDFDPLHRNWLGEQIMGVSGYCDKYLQFYRQRFEIFARIVASACESYKAKYGTFPSSLDALAPEFLANIPRDPYDGEMLRYNGERLFIWTPGEKLSFDGKVRFSRDGKPQTTPIMRRCVYFISNPEASDGTATERSNP